MGYNPPGSGLGGAQERKVEASKRLKKPLKHDYDTSAEAKRLLAIKQEHKANQDRLRAEYEASHPKPHPMGGFTGIVRGPLADLPPGDWCEQHKIYDCSDRGPCGDQPMTAGEFYHQLEQEGQFGG